MFCTVLINDVYWNIKQDNKVYTIIVDTSIFSKKNKR